MNIYKVLDTNEFYRDTFQGPQYPPLPEDVQGWNDVLQERFCILSLAHLTEGMTVEVADEMAIRQVKESEDFDLWSSR